MLGLDGGARPLLERVVWPKRSMYGTLGGAFQLFEGSMHVNAIHGTGTGIVWNSVKC